MTQIEGMRDAIDRLLPVGFIKYGRFHLDGDNLSVLADGTEGTLRSLYAFVAAGRVLYVGKSKLGLKKRLRGYCKPGPTQRTNIRVKEKIETALRDGQVVEIFAYCDDGLERRGEFILDTAAGLEDNIIASLMPEWNSSGKFTPTEIKHTKSLEAVTQAVKTDKQDGPKANNEFEVRLGKAYWDQGFFNVGVKYESLFGKHQSPLDIFLGSDNRAIVGYVNRTANPNGTPRIMAPVAMKEWFHRNSKLGGTVIVEVIDKKQIRLKKTRLM